MSELIEAKSEIINNLKTIMKETVQSNTENTEKTAALNNGKYGVKDCSEYLNIHAKNGAALNAVLLWADIQRQLHPEDYWKPLAVKGFLQSEITEAKELLWRTSDESIIGKMTKRQGASKSISEINDICAALKKLSEKDSVPMFISTSDMVAQTPIFNSTTTKKDSEIMSEQLKNINESIKALKDDITAGKINQYVDNHLQVAEDDSSDDKSKEQTRPLDLALGGTISITDIAAQVNNENDNSDGSEWMTQLSRNRREKGSKNDTDGIEFVATSSLVIHGVSTDVTVDMITEYLLRKNIKAVNCELLTKHDQARSFSFKLTVKAIDLQKAKNQNTWPNGVGVRMYNEPKERTERNNGGTGNNFNRRNNQVKGNRRSLERNLTGTSGPGQYDSLPIQTNPQHLLQQLQNISVPMNSDFIHPVSGIMMQQPVTGNGVPTPVCTNSNYSAYKVPSSYTAPQNSNDRPNQSRNVHGWINSYSAPDWSQANYTSIPASALSDPQRKVRFVDRLGTDEFVQRI